MRPAAAMLKHGLSSSRPRISASLRWVRWDNGWQPHRVDLHHAEVLGPIGIAMHDPAAATLHGLDRRQHPWRKMVRRRDENHAGHKRYHDGTTSSVA